MIEKARMRLLCQHLAQKYKTEVGGYYTIFCKQAAANLFRFELRRDNTCDVWFYDTDTEQFYCRYIANDAHAGLLKDVLYGGYNNVEDEIPEHAFKYFSYTKIFTDLMDVVHAQ